jgi:HemX protein
MLAVIVYGFSTLYSVFLWRKGFRRHEFATYILLALGFVLNSIAMGMRGYRLDHCPVSNLYEATMFVMWTIVVLCFAGGAWSRLRFLGAFASPVLFGLGVFALMPGLDTPKQETLFEVPTALTSIHAALLALAYGAFGLSSIAAVMFLTQENNLKFHKIQAVLSLMPPIQRLETATGGLLSTGFVLLSLGLAIGAFGLSRVHDPQLYRGDPKIVWSLLVWIIYAALIVMRWQFSQTGRRFAFGAIASFAFVLLTFWGTNLLSPLHNP